MARCPRARYLAPGHEEPDPAQQVVKIVHDELLSTLGELRSWTCRARPRT